MAFTLISIPSYNHRARRWKCTGDAAATVLTVPNDGLYFRRKYSTGTVSETAVSTALKTVTAFDYLAGKGGMLVASVGVVQAITSTVVNTDGTLTITFTAAPAAVVVEGITVWDMDRPNI